MHAARWTTLSLRLGRVVTGTSWLPAPFESNATLLRPPLPSQCPTESREGILPHLVHGMNIYKQFTVKVFKWCADYLRTCVLKSNTCTCNIFLLAVHYNFITFQGTEQINMLCSLKSNEIVMYCCLFETLTEALQDSHILQGFLQVKTVWVPSEIQMTHSVHPWCRWKIHHCVHNTDVSPVHVGDEKVSLEVSNHIYHVKNLGGGGP